MKFGVHAAVAILQTMLKSLKQNLIEQKQTTCRGQLNHWENEMLSFALNNRCVSSPNYVANVCKVD